VNTDSSPWQPYIDRLALPHPLNVVCFNGACAMELRAGHPGKVLFGKGLSLEATIAVLQACRELDLCVSWTASDQAYCNPQSREHAALLADYERLEGVKQGREDLRGLLTTGEYPLKLVAFSRHPDVDAKKAGLLLAPSLGVRVIAAEMHMEFLDASVSKGETLRKLCSDSLSLDMRHIVAFGDNHNDIEMLQLAGHGVAMRNAKPEVKAVADEVLGWSNDEEGVLVNPNPTALYRTVNPNPNRRSRDDSNSC
jgi:hydroxymethylpyrimidine pyrophosphatase-like HAD family hydrolase